MVRRVRRVSSDFVGAVYSLPFFFRSRSAVSESLPIMLILLVMHRKRKESVMPDVLIMHSIMSNLFGSTAQLDSATTSSATGEGGNAAGRIGALGRRFQSYGGGTRVDSFPPSGKPKRNIPRVVSSSGGGGHAPESAAALPSPS